MCRVSQFQGELLSVLNGIYLPFNCLPMNRESGPESERASQQLQLQQWLADYRACLMNSQTQLPAGENQQCEWVAKENRISSVRVLRHQLQLWTGRSSRWSYRIFDYLPTFLQTRTDHPGLTGVEIGSASDCQKTFLHCDSLVQKDLHWGKSNHQMSSLTLPR